MKRRPRFHWGVCANCREWPVRGCLCRDCLRAALVPLLLAALVQWLFKGVA